ncbi:MAG: tRNA 2-thiouridine(34) synthase MnmA [Candidatus Brocadiae bacterium]|nr:tRNA 2-thiouridine(34) synthase MnmA [Candidatus Brocadiia bacterium]
MGASHKKVVMAMSGGVDSSTAAALLKRQGHEVVGATLMLPFYREGTSTGSAESRSDGIESARRVAAGLGIPLHVLDVRREFRETVVADFCRAYGEGKTPNPCVRCNVWIKFGRLLQEAKALGARFVATGHYARKSLDADTGRSVLLAGRGADDQSYFLFGLSQDQLQQALFPLGDYTKDQVRRMATELGLSVSDRPDSQDLCFVPQGKYREFLMAQRPDAFRPGPIVHVSGKILGEHKGIGAYTIGQRRGLGIAYAEPLYVAGFEPERNAVLVGERQHILRKEITVAEVNWVAVPPPSRPLRASVKVRSTDAGAEAEVVPLADDRVRIEFAQPQEAPCPGQAAVFYRGPVVLGGGIIQNTLEPREK